MSTTPGRRPHPALCVGVIGTVALVCLISAMRGHDRFGQYTWYVYDNAGRPVWYVASNCTVSGTGCTGTLYRTTGPPFGPGFNPNSVQVFTVGSATIVFTDANNGTLSYTVNGVSGSKAITRQLF